MQKALFPCAAFVLALALSPAHAATKDPRVLKALMKMDPTTRMIQVCNMAVMKQTSAEKKGTTEHAMIDALAPLKISANGLTGSAGAFRRAGKWYKFAFQCTVTPDHTHATALKIDVKREIPRSEWEKDNLFP
ncbi:protein of unknown function [Faunimonas pinastri]|uniref:DUF930 domain-containing protein n=1 Tax=Faunimonas pinastri TaxID=1855383 RepID=A0A1H9L7W3_9HYPH|nr:DUF930 domain-containing protein [Faunimonas pinastri]SER07601.1 protein of unknown function [Faunimonas pinastri]